MVFQMVFRNPLVSPGFLGVSQGAGFGAAVAIIFFGSASLLVEGFAILFAFLGLGASYFFASRIRFGDWVLRLVLAGIAVSALFSAGLGVLKYLADPLAGTAQHRLLASGWFVGRDLARSCCACSP